MSCHDHADNCCYEWCDTCQWFEGLEPLEKDIIKTARALVAVWATGEMVVRNLPKEEQRFIAAVYALEGFRARNRK